VRPPYHIARQEHLGDLLDVLVARGHLRGWRWDYEDRRAIWWIDADGSFKRYDTASAERLVLPIAGEHGIVWRAVLHPGGAEQLDKLPIDYDHCWRCGFTNCRLHPDAVHPKLR
jgi:hypothetical protein